MQSKKGKEPRRRQQGRRGCTGSCTGVMRHHSRRPNDAHAVLLHGSGAPLITSRNLLNWLIDGRRSWSVAADEESKFFFTASTMNWNTGRIDARWSLQKMSKRSVKIKKSRSKAMRKAKTIWTGDETADAQELAIFFCFGLMSDGWWTNHFFFFNFTIRFVIALSSSSLHCRAGRWVVSW
jgi:hypothetical protein